MNKRRIGLALGALFLSLIISVPAFAFTANSVLSHDIREADGTSGQDTNSGSGIKTGHIQDEAVTAAKIADGAVTDAKIAGPISASKISSTGLDADTVDGMHAVDFAPALHAHGLSDITGLEAALGTKADVGHNHDGTYQKKYAKTAVVAQGGGDYTDPVAAMNDIATWCGTPSAANPCLLKIMPGVYTLASGLEMKTNVDVEGSGANTTKLVGTVYDTYSYNNELRMITVENADTPIYMYVCDHCGIRDASIVAGNQGIYMEGTSNATLKHVNINVTDSTPGGEVYGIFSVYPNGDLHIEDSTISVSGGGMSDGAYGFNGFYGIIGRADLFIKNSKITVSEAAGGTGIKTAPFDTFLTGVEVIVEGGIGGWGISNSYVGNVTIRDSRIKAYDRSISQGNAWIANTQIEGPIRDTTSLKCFGVYDGNFDPYVCP